MFFFSWVLAVVAALLPVVECNPNGGGCGGWGGSSVTFREVHICETSPYTKSYSGYITLPSSPSTNLFFWFFESRTANPRTAPLTVWLNGGPGATSMTQAVNGHNGPCVVQPNGNSTAMNPWSWNKASNMLYIDQPAGTGFSYGSNMADTTAKVAKQVAEAVRIWRDHWKFSDYKRESINIWSQSYGGHFAPAIAVLLKNHMRINSVGVINGIFDILVQAPSYPVFAVNNTYNIKTIPDEAAAAASQAMTMPGGCADQAAACRQLQETYDPQNTGANSTVNNVCFGAFQFCWGNVYYVYEAISGRSAFDIKQQLPDPIPSPIGKDFLNKQWVRQPLGAQLPYADTNDTVNTAFLLTGDFLRSYTPELNLLLTSNVKVALIYGDRDYRANWFGGEALSLSLNFPGKFTFAATPYANIITGGYAPAVKGKVRQHGGLSFGVVYEAGHEVPYYQGEAALRIFERTLRGRGVATGI
ncbi:putative carboxypeptidase [Podospora aff. communis PSN243]|uniref:Carboxypeptidase n=1 Tax=Podospora aff. communis PSN243 TaxID=3040156 RepID=A0AAV9GV85_9PEZI|nr:putative carboxypeptidase [Podospora aff. communis PSN243]